MRERTRKKEHQVSEVFGWFGTRQSESYQRERFV